MKNFLNRYFYPVDVVPQNRCFSPEHIVISGILLLIIAVIFYRVTKKQSPDYTRKVLKGCALLMLFLEFFRILWNAAFKGLSLTCFRFDFCNQICMVLPFIILFNENKLFPYCEVLSLVGGFTVLIYPLWVFYDYAGFHLMALQSMISHALMALCGLLMPMLELPSKHQLFMDTLTGFLIIVAVSFVMARLTGVNYFLSLSADGIPILSKIPYPYYFLVFYPFSFMVGWIICRVYHYTFKRIDRRFVTA